MDNDSAGDNFFFDNTFFFTNFLVLVVAFLVLVSTFLVLVGAFLVLVDVVNAFLVLIDTFLVQDGGFFVLGLLLRDSDALPISERELILLPNSWLRNLSLLNYRIRWNISTTTTDLISLVFCG